MHFGWQRCIQILWRKWSEAGRNTLRWKKVGNLVWIFGGAHGEQQQDWQCWSTQHIDFHVRRAPGMVGSDKKKFFHLHNLFELIGQKKFSNCPKFLKHENIFRMPQKFGHKWKLSSTFIRCRLLLSKMRICEEKNAVVLSARDRLAESVLFFPFFFQFCDVSHSYQHPKKWIFLKWLTHLYRTIKAVASRKNLITASCKKILGKIWRIFYFKEGICEEKNAAVLLLLPVQLLQLLSNLVH